MSCISCKNHSKNRVDCLHGFETKLLNKYTCTRTEEDIFEMLHDGNHNFICFKYCTHKNKPKI